MNITNEAWVKILTENQVYTKTVEVACGYLHYKEKIYQYNATLVDTECAGNVHSLIFNTCLEIETQPEFEYTMNPVELTLTLVGEKLRVTIKLDRIVLSKN